MKILYLITKCERGGAQSHLWTLLQLQRSGTPVLAVGEDGFLADQAREAGVPVHILPHFVHPVRPWLDLLALREVVDLIRAEKPGLIHAHTAKAGMLARLAGLLTGTPTLYTVHGWSFIGLRSRLSRELAVWLERALSLTDQTVIDVSQSSFAMAEQLAVAPRTNHLKIWNGIADTGLRAAIAKHGGPVRIIMIARFCPQKDHCILLEALAPLPRNWQCTLVGSGPDQDRVEACAARLGLQQQVRFLGDRDDIPELLAQSDLFVLCSNWESLPISILEAMRAGLPVIATSVGGCAELVADGVTGLLTERGNVEQLRGHLERLLASRSLLDCMGRAGRARFEAEFRVERMVQQTEAAYSRLARTSCPSPSDATLLPLG
jgi:glycosyltransferase involved in cell wall biosynthesis